MRYWLVILAGCGRVGFDAGDPAAGRPAVDGATAALTYVATIAECIDPNAPDLTTCSSTNGADQLVVDGRDGTTNDPWQAYLRFDLDDAVSGRSVTAVRLVMTATDDSKANGPDSGAVWRVDPFDQPALATRTPTKLAKLGDSNGAVDQDDRVVWNLPIDVLGPSVFIGVITTDQTGGVNYWNLRGSDPPRLEIETD